MHAAISYTDAAEALLNSLNESRPGFIARIDLSGGQLELAEMLAKSRRTLAKLSQQRGPRNYQRALAAPSDSSEISRLAADRRGVLAELLVDELLSLTAARYELQPYVSQKPVGGLDLDLGGKRYDVKAAGQMSAAWSPAAAAGRLIDDRLITVNAGDHARYIRAGLAGYVCVYFYMRDGVPFSADLFLFTAAQVASLPVHEPPAHSSRGSKDMRYHSLALPFPDSRQYEGRESRRAALAA